MANHKSAVKRHKQSVKKNLRNRSIKSSAKNAVKNARAEIKAGATSAASSVKSAESILAKASAKGILHKKSAARKISRLAKRLNAKKASK